MIFHIDYPTTLRYYIGTEFEQNIIARNEEYEKMVNNGEINLSKPLTKQFEHILNLLNNSKYKLELCFTYNVEISSPINLKSKIKFSENYGGGPTFVQTQLKVNKDTLKEYKKAIQGGIRPIAVLLQVENDSISYILDGHHKLLAYKELGIEPKILMVTKLQSTEFNYDNGIKIMHQLGLLDEEIAKKYKQATPFSE